MKTNNINHFHTTHFSIPQNRGTVQFESELIRRNEELDRICTSLHERNEMLHCKAKILGVVSLTLSVSILIMAAI